MHYVFSIYLSVFVVFFFNDTATTEIYTLSLHDALPISRRRSTRPRSRPSSAASLPRLTAVREQIKQLLKNSVYRTIGETARGIGAASGDGRTLRVLMYHKVNDLAGNRMSMPVATFDEQMTQLKEFGYTVVDLDAVISHYVEGRPLAEGAVLITFDDGYRDNLENAAPILQKHGYAAVQFVPLAYVGDRQPLPHEEHLAANGVLNPTVDWDELGELEKLGVRIESHGISHRPLADLEIDEAARE